MTIKIYKEGGAVRIVEGVRVLYCNHTKDLYLSIYGRPIPLIIGKESYKSYEVCEND